MVQFDAEVLNELEQRMEERFQELNFMEDDGEERMEVDEEPTDTGQGHGGQRKQTVAQRLRRVEKEIDRAGQDISGIAIEIAEIITKAQATDDEVSKLKRENEEMKGRITAVCNHG